MLNRECVYINLKQLFPYIKLKYEYSHWDMYIDQNDVIYEVFTQNINDDGKLNINVYDSYIEPALNYKYYSLEEAINHANEILNNIEYRLKRKDFIDISNSKYAYGERRLNQCWKSEIKSLFV